MLPGTIHWSMGWRVLKSQFPVWIKVHICREGREPRGVAMTDFGRGPMAKKPEGYRTERLMRLRAEHPYLRSRWTDY
jgi:hypothetical protein